MTKAELNKLKPIPVSLTKGEETKSYERVLIQYKASDLDDANKTGRFYLPPDSEKKGEYALEFGTVYATSDENGWLKKGDEVASSYQLLMRERGNGYWIFPDGWMGADEDGNEYSFAVVDENNVFAKITNNKIEPLHGWLFCELVKEEEIKSGLMIIPETAKKVTSDRKPYYTKILFINEQDKECNTLNIKLNVGDEILCRKNSDIPIKLKGKEYIRVEMNEVYGKRSEFESLKFEN